MANENIYLFKSKYAEQTDEDLIKLIRSGDKNALNYLIEKYSDIVQMKTNKFYINGAEKDDIIQEGLIGLYKAISSFDLEKENSFKTFANLCVERQVITAIKSSNRQKHMPLNSYLSLNNNAYDENNDTELIEVFNTKTMEDPLETITRKEYYKFVESKIEESLSSFEKQVLERYIQGESYVDIAARLDTPVKSVDNAIQRIRKKANKNINDDEM